MRSIVNHDVRCADGVTLFLPPSPPGGKANLAQPDVHAESQTALYPIGTLAWYPGLGMKYRYSKAGDALSKLRELLYNGNLVPDATGHANEDGFFGKVQVDGSNVAIVAGAEEISFTDTIDRVKDYYAGSYLITWGAVYERSYIISGPAAPTVSTWQNTIVKLQHPKKYAEDSGKDIEIWLNPYSNITQADDIGTTVGTNKQFQTAMGVAEIPVQEGFYFWLQTAGPAFITPNGWGANCPGYTANKREVFATLNGGLATVIGVTLSGDQRIGTIMSRTPSTSADAWVNLDLDIGH